MSKKYWTCEKCGLSLTLKEVCESQGHSCEQSKPPTPDKGEKGPLASKPCIRKEHELSVMTGTYCRCRVDALLAEQRRNRCDICDAKLNLNGCDICGAPNCCPSCCRVATLEAKQFAHEKEVGRLKEELSWLRSDGVALILNNLKAENTRLKECINVMTVFIEELPHTEYPCAGDCAKCQILAREAKANPS